MEESLRTNDSVTQTASRYADMLVLPNSGMASVFGGYTPISRELKEEFQSLIEQGSPYPRIVTNRSADSCCSEAWKAIFTTIPNGAIRNRTDWHDPLKYRA